MLIDTHAHLNMLENPAFEIAEARLSDVKEIIVPTAGIEDIDAVLKFAENDPDIYAALGVHPEYADNFDDEAAELILNKAHHNKVVAIGEIGLDYHYNSENKISQKKCFSRQIEIAKELNLPLIIHDRDAHADTLEILKAQKVERALLHCFSGSVEFMKECTKLGYKIAIGGVVTFKNAKTIKEVAQQIDIKDLMLETDCPYLTPHPFRGMENSPKYIGFVAKEIAKIGNISYDAVAVQTTKNAREFFNI